jgi:hypothetical protein
VTMLAPLIRGHEGLLHGEQVPSTGRLKLNIFVGSDGLLVNFVCDELRNLFCCCASLIIVYVNKNLEVWLNLYQNMFELDMTILVNACLVVLFNPL